MFKEIKSMLKLFKSMLKLFVVGLESSALTKEEQKLLAEDDAALANEETKAKLVTQLASKDNEELVGLLLLSLGQLSGAVLPNMLNLVVDEILRRNPVNVTGDDTFNRYAKLNNLFEALGCLIASRKEIVSIPQDVSERLIKRICESNASTIPSEIVKLFNNYEVRKSVPEGPTIIRQVIENVRSSNELDTLMKIFNNSPYQGKGSQDYITAQSYIKACVSRFSDEKKLSKTNEVIFGDDIFDFSKAILLADTMEQDAAVRSVANAIIVAAGIKKKIDIENIQALENIPQEIKAKLVAMAEHLTQGKAFEDNSAQDFYTQAKENLSVDALAAYNSSDFKASGARVFPHIQSEKELLNIAKERLVNLSRNEGNDCFGYSEESNVATYITSQQSKLKLLRYAAGLDRETEFHAPNSFSNKVFSSVVLAQIEDVEDLRQLKQEIEEKNSNTRAREKTEILRNLSTAIEDRGLASRAI